MDLEYAWDARRQELEIAWGARRQELEIEVEWTWNDIKYDGRWAWSVSVCECRKGPFTWLEIRCARRPGNGHLNGH